MLINFSILNIEIIHANKKCWAGSKDVNMQEHFYIAILMHYLPVQHTKKKVTAQMTIKIIYFSRGMYDI